MCLGTYGGRKVNPRPCWYVCSPLALERQITAPGILPYILSYLSFGGLWVGHLSSYQHFFKLKENKQEILMGKSDGITFKESPSLTKAGKQKQATSPSWQQGQVPSV